MSIKRTIQLLLDRTAAKRVEKDTGRALDRGTDPKKAKANLKKVESSFARLKKLALGIGLALGGALVIRKITQFGKESVRVATEAAGIWNRLAGQLRNAGVEFSDVQDEIEGTARALQDVTTVGDEQFAEIMTELVGTTNDYAKSLAEVETVANLAAAKQIDMKTAAQLVGRALVGETGTLSRYGIIVEEGADAMEVLRARFAGMARNEARELEGRTKQLSNEWSDFKQAIGDAMIAAGGGTSVLDTMIGTVKGLTNWVNENRSRIAFWGSLVIDVFKAVGKTVVGIGKLIQASFNVVADSVVLLVRQIQLDIARVVDFAANTINRLIEAANKLPGIDIDFRMGGMDVAAFEAQRDAALELLTGDLGDVAAALVLVGEGWVDVGKKALFAERSQRSAVEVVTAPKAPAPPPLEAVEIFDEEAIRARGLLAEQLQAERGAAAEAQMELLERRAMETAEGMTSAFETFFAASAAGFSGAEGVWETAGQAAREAGAAIVGGLVAGRVEEQMAQGVAALASGIWPPNPAALLAAGKHFAAAALFRAIPGAIRGGGGTGGGGGGAGAQIPRGALGSSAPGAAQPAGPEIHIYIDPLSPADPDFQRVVLGATQSAQERFGENVNVNIHPRTGGRP